MGLLNLGQLLRDEGFGEAQGAMAEAIATHKAQAKARLAGMLVSVLDTAESSLKTHVAHLKALRKQEKLASEKIKKLDKAIKFLMKTGNPLPFYKESGRAHEAVHFCQSIGVDTPDTDDKLNKERKGHHVTRGCSC